MSKTTTTNPKPQEAAPSAPQSKLATEQPSASATPAPPRVEVKSEGRITKSEARRRKAAENRKQKAEYERLKAEILRREEDNLKSLYLLKTIDGWYKMFGHSAIIYVYQIAPRLHLRPRLLSDSDYHCRSDDGVVTIRDLDSFDKNMQSMKIYCRYQKGNVVIYELGYKVSQEDLNQLRRTEELKEERANKLFLPVEKMPSLRVELKELTRNIHDSVRKLDEPTRRSIGADLDRKACQLLGDFQLMVTGWADTDQYLERAMRDLKWINAQLFVLSDIKVLPKDKVFRLQELADKAMKRVSKEYNGRQGKRSKKSTK